MKKLILALTISAVGLSACRSTLYSAARDGDLQTVKEELAEGADPEGKASGANLIWQVPTYLLALPIDIVRLLGPITLIEPFIDPGWEFSGEVDKNGNRKLRFNDDTFLTKKVYQFGDKTAMSVTKNPEIITELLLAGAAGSDFQKAKATSEAARKGDAATLQKLLQKGIKASWYCSGDYNPLMLAIGGGHEECARVLLANGATFSDTVTVGGKEITCYDYAVSKGQAELYKNLGGTIIAAPNSVRGKKIVLDFSQAKSQTGNYDNNGKIQWGAYINDTFQVGAWKKCDPSQKITPVFGKNNKWERPDRLGGDWAKWEYKKTGPRTAVLSNSAHEWNEEWELRFDSATTGTASGGCNDDCTGYENAVNIRFTIK